MNHAKIIDGLAVSKGLREAVARRAAALKHKGIKPSLAVILVGDDPASAVYVRNKVKGCEQNGLLSHLDRLRADIAEPQLLARIEELNADPDTHGILFLLPRHINSHKVIETISADKDVDGFHVANAGSLMTGMPRFRPCTPYGVMKMLEAYQIPTSGKNAVVMGRSTSLASRWRCSFWKPVRRSPFATAKRRTWLTTPEARTLLLLRLANATF
jgi:methylenetetrahydrofolate dehydrogenase (NADP+)/methenyltetrahydrofolate cyclohydrolase